MAFGEGLQNVWEKIKREVPKLPGKAVAAARNNLMDGRDLANKIVEMAAEQVVMAPFTGGITNPATMLTGYVPEAQAMIRPGGNPALNMFKSLTSHDAGKLLNSLVKRGYYTNPSVGIGKNSIFAFSTSPTLVLNPTSHLFDPQYAKANQLYNRDSFSFVNEPMAQTKPYRLYGHDVRGTEHSSVGGKGDNFVMSSPRFQGFRHYENDKSGAAILRSEGYDDSEIYNEMLKLQHTYHGDHMFSGMLEHLPSLRADASSGNEAAKNLLSFLQTAPTNYAELKVIGTVPINPDTVSALILPETTYKHTRDFIKEQVSKKGIRVGTPAELLPQEHKSKYVDVAKNIAEWVNTGSHFKEYDDLPEVAKPYIQRYNFADLQVAQNPITAAVKQIKQSDAFAADVASILTAQDSDDLLNLLWKDK